MVTPLGIEIDDNEAHLENAERSINLTPFGMLIEVKFEQAKNA